ncbi:DsrE family protein [Acidihalobacter prosperus]
MVSRLFFRAFLTLMSLGLLAAGPASAAMKMPPIKQKPFATHHIVMQISQGSARRQHLVLNVAANLSRYYGPDKVDIEIVAFGPGLRLLLNNNVNKKRVDALARNFGIQFDACHNTLMHFTKKLGYKPKLDPVAVVVPAGAARIVQLQKHGYSLLKP